MVTRILAYPTCNSKVLDVSTAKVLGKRDRLASKSGSPGLDEVPAKLQTASRSQQVQASDYLLVQEFDAAATDTLSIEQAAAASISAIHHGQATEEQTSAHIDGQQPAVASSSSNGF